MIAICSNERHVWIANGLTGKASGRCICKKRDWQKMTGWEYGDSMTFEDDTRPFPIQGGYSFRDEEGKMQRPKRSTVPWWLAEEAYRYYVERFGNQQSLERLAERGGFGRKELILLLRRDDKAL